MILKFGKYAGQSITTVPKDYLQFLLKQSWVSFQMREAIEATLKGTYVSPVAIPEQRAERPAPYDPDMLGVKQQATRRAITAVAEGIAGKMCGECRAKVVAALVDVAKQLGV